MVQRVIGEEAHIVAEADRGPRADPSMPKTERNSYPNMILLCMPHHTFVDSENGAHFTVEQLHKMKAEHEARVIQRLSDPQEQTAKRRDESLAELQIASRARLISRWAAAGLSDEVSGMLADDTGVGCGPASMPDIAPIGVVVLEGEFGSGKSVTAERLHQADITAAASTDAPLPVYLNAEDVPGSLRHAIADAVEPLGDPTHHGVRVVLDGMDEIDSTRAHKLLGVARELVESWPGSRILMTARPGLEVRDSERVAYPTLSDQEAHALADRVGTHVSLHAESAAIRDALRLPLFIIIAATAQNEGWEAPQSRVDLLEKLVQRALQAAGGDRDDAASTLAKLAWLTVEGGGPVPAGELGGEPLIRAVLMTRLVVRRGRTLRFGLPILEQHFAGRALLEKGLPDHALDSPAALERWRYPLALAVAACGWQQSDALLRPLVLRYPGIASWIIREAIPEVYRGSASALPSSVQAGQRVHHTLTSWLSALKPAADLALYGAVPAPPLVLGHFVAGGELVTALKTDPGPVQDEVVELPRPVDHEALETFMGRRGRWHSGPPPTDYPAWPWQWSLDWMTRGLRPVLSRQLPAAHCDAWVAERRWALCRALVKQKGFLLKPVDAEAVVAAARQHTASVRVTFSSARRPGLSATGSDLTRLVAHLEAGEGVDGHGQIHSPIPAPDLPAGNNRWVMGTYSESALVSFAVYIYETAIAIYKELCEQWFPALVPTLGLAAMLPVSLSGTVSRMSEGNQLWTGVNYCQIPRPASESSSAAFALGPPPAEDWINSSMEAAHEGLQRLRPDAAPWSRPSYIIQRFGSSSDTPATDIAHSWLWKDLARLKLITGTAPGGWT
ncbi:NACHT domain-containing protein [Streptomyces chartreusis]|uniref:NACHT domain-containing protein n=1 Tax=Streptomyces chartreusis TaxID=1969 RepID=UPI003721B8D5